jgi:hypothetical protein
MLNVAEEHNRANKGVGTAYVSPGCLFDRADASSLALFIIDDALRVSQNSSINSFICLVVYLLYQSASLDKFLSGNAKQFHSQIACDCIGED